MTTRALLIVDVLEGIFQLGVELYDVDRFVANVRTLLRRARESGAMVGYVRHCGPTGSPFEPGAPGQRIHQSIEPTDGEAIVDKHHPDAFQDSTLHELLQRAGIDELVVCGFATEACVDTTARSAYAKGYRVVLISDAHTTTDNAVLSAQQVVAHHNLILQRFAEVHRTDELGW